LAPIYGGLTFLLWVLLLMIGEDPFVALCHAMSTLATSGITPLLNFSDSDVHVGAELVIFAFFAFALTRRSFSSDLPSTARMPLRRDPELRVALAVILMTVLVLVARHWYVAAELRTPPSFALAIQALWGGVFTSLSFLTTTGFVSDNWSETQLWSSITTPGALLMGLALVGGGVATTAGGVKLLRIYVLYKHGQQEVSRLIHPSSVGGLGSSGRWVPAQAAFMAWLFFMIVALSITTTMLALSATGLDFETSTVLTLAAISTTGPLTDVAISPPIDLRNLDIAAKLLLAGAMALGRLETLAIIALLNPDFWRK
ncbi:MAG: potassium transporter TrkG, partial [Mangrovicoccus sp.]